MLKMKLISLLGLGFAFLLAGCASVEVQDYSNEGPRLKLEEYLNGDLTAYGMFQDRSGLVVKRFEVSMKGTWKDNVGILEEDFVYSDGSKSRRVWTIKKISEDKYVGTASDVIGEAHGEVAGNAFFWNYTLDLPVGETTYKVEFNDWMYLMNDTIMLNRSKMSKFGIYLGEVTLTFIKRSP